MPAPLPEVEGLEVRYPGTKNPVRAVDGVSFSLQKGETYALVGESGCGKSATGFALLQLVEPGEIVAGSIKFEGRELIGLPDEQMRRLRGASIGMVFQEASAALNPVMRVGDQISEAYMLHANTTKAQARTKSIEMLVAVAIRDPERVYNMYPHEVSGGMGQRIMIAMMMIPNPKILIADEPTSALDVSVQMQVLEIMDRLVRERGMGLIFISHDLNLVSTFCDRVLIMYAGKIVETCKADRLHEARHPYTKGLLNSLPRLDAPRERLDVLSRDPAWRDQPSVSGML